MENSWNEQNANNLYQILMQRHFIFYDTYALGYTQNFQLSCVPFVSHIHNRYGLPFNICEWNVTGFTYGKCGLIYIAFQALRELEVEKQIPDVYQVGFEPSTVISSSRLLSVVNPLKPKRERDKEW